MFVNSHSTNELVDVISSRPGVRTRIDEELNVKLIVVDLKKKENVSDSQSIVRFLEKIATREDLIAALGERDGVVVGLREDGVKMILINPSTSHRNTLRKIGGN